MKIAVIGPGLRKSAIGRASALIVRQLLGQGHSVVVVRSEMEDLLDQEAHDFGVGCIGWIEDSIADLCSTVDLVVYHVGNNYPYHRGCVELLPKFPGLVCLHDNFLGHLFWGHADKVGRGNVDGVLARLYGDVTSLRFFHHSNAEDFLEFAAEHAPMTEWIAELASGVIVHSRWAVDRITRVSRGPVEVVPLPYDAPFPSVRAPASHGAVAERVRRTVLTIGHVNPNKRHASVIEAIGSSEVLKGRLAFRAAGPVDPVMAGQLLELAHRNGVDFELAGEVDDLKLASMINEADLMCCLRWPALEAASASTIEAMLYGKPVIVTDTGFYRDLPDDCVVKIAPENEIGNLRFALERLVAQPLLASEMGVRAQQYALATFRADRYAERLVALYQDIEQAQLLSGLADGVADTIRRWGGADERSILDPIVEPLSIFR
jgi:glycosyltransferase involved in cell wall biosynthesis